MWYVSGNNLQMCEADYGIKLPVAVTGATLDAQDTLRFTIKNVPNGQTILVKDYTPSQNSATLELTEAESALFPVGLYSYSLDWYENGSFMCNLIPQASFRVVDKT